MSRTTATYVGCDNPDCTVAVEVPPKDEKHVPRGWYAVGQANEKDEVPDPVKHGFVCCSLDCVAAWAIERDAALAENAGRTNGVPA